MYTAYCQPIIGRILWICDHLSAHMNITVSKSKTAESFVDSCLLCAAPKYCLWSLADHCWLAQHNLTAVIVRHAMLSRHMLHILIYFLWSTLRIMETIKSLFICFFIYIIIYVYIYIMIFYGVRGFGPNHVCCTFWCFRQQLIKLVPVLTKILRKSP